jgi:hypothetical protein
MNWTKLSEPPYTLIGIGTLGIIESLFQLPYPRLALGLSSIVMLAAGIDVAQNYEQTK